MANPIPVNKRFMNISFRRQVYTISDNFFMRWPQRIVRLKPRSQ